MRNLKNKTDMDVYNEIINLAEGAMVKPMGKKKDMPQDDADDGSDLLAALKDDEETEQDASEGDSETEESSDENGLSKEELQQLIDDYKAKKGGK